jgi:hypothetical protein
MKFEQLQDFTSMRPFRWSLFCRAGAPINRVATPDRVAGLFASGDFTPAPGPGKKTFAFRGKDGVEFETDDPRLGDIFARLSQGSEVLLDDYASAPDIVEALLRLYVNSALALSTEPPLHRRTAGEKPMASPLARAQAQNGDSVLAALHHKPVRMEDPFWRVFLPQIDGAHSHEDLAQFVAAETGKTIGDAREQIPQALQEVARNRLLME